MTGHVLPARKFAEGVGNFFSKKPKALEAPTLSLTAAERILARQRNVAPMSDSELGLRSVDGVDPLSSYPPAYRSGKEDLNALLRESDNEMLFEHAQKAQQAKASAATSKHPDAGRESRPEDDGLAVEEAATQSATQSAVVAVQQPTYVQRLVAQREKLEAFDQRLLRPAEIARLTEQKKLIEIEMLEPVRALKKAEAAQQVVEAEIRRLDQEIADRNKYGKKVHELVDKKTQAERDLAEVVRDIQKQSDLVAQLRLSNVFIEAEGNRYTLKQIQQNADKIKQAQDATLKALKGSGSSLRKAVNKVLSKEVQEILRSSEPPAKKVEAVKAHLQKLEELSLLDPKNTKLTKSQKELIAKITSIDAKQAEADLDAHLAEIEKLSGPQGGVFKNAIAKLSGCSDWRMFKQARAFDKQIKHLDIDYLVGCKTVDELNIYLSKFMKPVTKIQENLIAKITEIVQNKRLSGNETSTVELVPVATTKLKRALNAHKQLTSIKKIILDKIAWVAVIGVCVAAITAVSVLSFGAPEIAVALAGAAAVVGKFYGTANRATGGRLTGAVRGFAEGLGIVQAARSAVETPTAKSEEVIKADVPRKAALRERILKPVEPLILKLEVQEALEAARKIEESHRGLPGGGLSTVSDSPEPAPVQTVVRLRPRKDSLQDSKRGRNPKQHNRGSVPSSLGRKKAERPSDIALPTTREKLGNVVRELRALQQSGDSYSPEQRRRMKALNQEILQLEAALRREAESSPSG